MLPMYLFKIVLERNPGSFFKRSGKQLQFVKKCVPQLFFALLSLYEIEKESNFVFLEKQNVMMLNNDRFLLFSNFSRCGAHIA